MTIVSAIYHDIFSNKDNIDFFLGFPKGMNPVLDIGAGT